MDPKEAPRGVEVQLTGIVEKSVKIYRCPEALIEYAEVPRESGEAVMLIDGKP